MAPDSLGFFAVNSDYLVSIFEILYLIEVDIKIDTEILKWLPFILHIAYVCA